MTRLSDSWIDLNASIAKITHANLNRSNFLWKPEALWNSQDLRFFTKYSHPSDFQLTMPPAMLRPMKDPSVITHQLRYILEIDGHPIGSAQLQAFQEYFTRGFIFPYFQGELGETQTDALAFLISTAFIICGCDTVRLPEGGPNFSGCAAQSGEFLTFVRDRGRYNPEYQSFITLEKKAWLNQGPGRNHASALLYLTPSKPQYKKRESQPSRHMLTSVFRRFRGMPIK